MRYLLVATDYDGTIASQGQVDDSALAALERVRASGRKLILVTGRHLPDLNKVFNKLDLFHRVVAENGALLYRPASRQEKLLCEPPPQRLLLRLRELQIPFSVGRGIVATREPHQGAVLNAIRKLGLELHVIFNKGAVMVLPSGVNKETGLKAALDELGVSPHNVVGFGDAENDHAFLATCECAVAVANALPVLKERADIVTQGTHGAGVVEVIEQLLSDDLARYDSRLFRHSISLGQSMEDRGKPILLSPHRDSILIAGPSASGKSTVVAGILEGLLEQKYQFCLVDPEGDYGNFGGAISLGTAKKSPDIDELWMLLEDPARCVIVNLLGVPVSDRPKFFSGFLPRLQELRARTARPHWLIIDEAHHLLPSSWLPASTTVPQALESTILITVHPDHVSPAVLNAVDVMIATGKSPMSSFRSFANVLRVPPPSGADTDLQTGEALVWFRRNGHLPVRVRTTAGEIERRRHLRQYAEGELSAQQSFYFRGAEGKLNLRAQNLVVFMQLADGVDDTTWVYHLRQGDYSHWFRHLIKDEELADETAAIEQDTALSAQESRSRIKSAIERRYTAPA